MRASAGGRGGPGPARRLVAPSRRARGTASLGGPQMPRAAVGSRTPILTRSGTKRPSDAAGPPLGGPPGPLGPPSRLFTLLFPNFRLRSSSRPAMQGRVSPRQIDTRGLA